MVARMDLVSQINVRSRPFPVCWEEGEAHTTKQRSLGTFSMVSRPLLNFCHTSLFPVFDFPHMNMSCAPGSSEVLEIFDTDSTLSCSLGNVAY